MVVGILSHLFCTKLKLDFCHIYSALNGSWNFVAFILLVIYPLCTFICRSEVFQFRHIFLSASVLRLCCVLHSADDTSAECRTHI